MQFRANRGWQNHKLPEAAELPCKRIHDLRACASLLLAQRHEMRVIKGVLGNSQISLTANTYSHVAQSLKRAADSLERIFGGTAAP